MIPVWVLTGFLGSGKTTLLGRCLKHPAFARTAVIINEFGEIGLDHDLIETSEESFVTLRTGCLCCRVRDDLLLTLEDLLRRRVEGVLAPFERIIIETSGLADPGPILMALMTDQDIAGRIALAGVVTTVDAVHALATLDRHGEAIRQIAVADRLVVTKTDLVAAPGEQLTARLAALNPAAAVIAAAFGAVDAEQLFAGSGGKEAADLERWLASTPAASQPAQPHQAIASVALVRETPMRAVALTLLLECLAEHCGSDLLRLKGLIQIAECPDRPAVVHGVGHVIEPPAWLERWPSADRRSRLVLIGRKLQAAWVEALATALEAEVAEVLAAGQA